MILSSEGALSSLRILLCHSTPFDTVTLEQENGSYSTHTFFYTGEALFGALRPGTYLLRLCVGGQASQAILVLPPKARVTLGFHRTAPRSKV